MRRADRSPELRERGFLEPHPRPKAGGAAARGGATPLPGRDRAPAPGLGVEGTSPDRKVDLVGARGTDGV